MTSTDTSVDVRAGVLAVLVGHARLAVEVAALADTDDLYAAGMTSHASVNVMLALEDSFDVEFPERLLRKSTFGSVEEICAAINELLEEG